MTDLTHDEIREAAEMAGGQLVVIHGVRTWKFSIEYGKCFLIHAEADDSPALVPYINTILREKCVERDWQVRYSHDAQRLSVWVNGMKSPNFDERQLVARMQISISDNETRALVEALKQ